MNNLLEVHQLRIHFPTYSGNVEAIKDVNFIIRHGEILGIVGESGSGKSVTAGAILGLLAQGAHVVSGRIHFENQFFNLLDEKQMREIRGKKIGWVPQDPLTALNPTMRIGKQVIEGIIQHEHISELEAYKIATVLLEQVGINDVSYRMKQYPHELSGGMRQRVLIAIALACKPQLLIADEPTTALDVTIQAQILNLLKNIQKQRQFSLIFISHDLGIISNMCDRVIVMENGSIVEEGSIQAIFSNPEHMYTKRLINAALHSLGIENEE